MPKEVKGKTKVDKGTKKAPKEKSAPVAPAKKEKPSNPPGTITLGEAREILEKKNHSISRLALATLARKAGFVSEHEGTGREKILIEVTGLRQWITNTLSAPPAGYVSIPEAAEKLGYSAAYIFGLIKKHKIETIIHGPGRGATFFNLKTMTTILSDAKKSRDARLNEKAKALKEKEAAKAKKEKEKVKAKTDAPPAKGKAEKSPAKKETTPKSEKKSDSSSKKKQITDPIPEPEEQNPAPMADDFAPELPSSDNQSEPQTNPDADAPDDDEAYQERGDTPDPDLEDGFDDDEDDPDEDEDESDEDEDESEDNWDEDDDDEDEDEEDDDIDPPDLSDFDDDDEDLEG
jgi:hypothetical protein